MVILFLFIDACRKAFSSDRENLAETWKELTDMGPLFFRGLLPRLSSVPRPAVRLGVEIIPIQRRDPTGWLDYAAAAALFVALIPFGRGTLTEVMATFVVPFANWTIGTRWRLAASELTAEPGQTVVLEQ